MSQLTQQYQADTLDLLIISTKEYYDKYIDSAEHKCLFCEKEARFDSLGKGYHITCRSKECAQKLSEKTKLEKYGNEHYNNPAKAAETYFKRYGENYYKMLARKAHEAQRKNNYA